MQLLKRFLRALLSMALIAFIVIQFFHPEKNDSNDETQAITTKFEVPKEVVDILKTSCYDCHSNHTNYPWYSKIQPVDWWLDHHVKEGNEEVNFSVFASYSPRRQYRKFVEIKEQIEEGEMPLEVYTLTHKDAILNEQQKQLVIQWSLAMKDTMEHHYPIDSLQRKKM
ncbi:MAG: heme-binding domain-containing protein [Chitinophagaceae bacterium]|nr:heme-binding domain-containing protein [Chitinophagaceae bacterium]